MLSLFDAEPGCSKPALLVPVTAPNRISPPLRKFCRCVAVLILMTRKSRAMSCTVLWPPPHPPPPHSYHDAQRENVRACAGEREREDSVPMDGKEAADTWHVLCKYCRTGSRPQHQYLCTAGSLTRQQKELHHMQLAGHEGVGTGGCSDLLFAIWPLCRG